MKRVIYPGSFDPITKGHMNIIDQATNLFDEVIIAVMQNSNKKAGLFSIEERIEMIKEIYKKIDKIKVITGSGATVDLAILHECNAIIRGLRTLTDFDYELQLAQINKEISNNQVNTICLFADRDYQFISSSMIRELHSLDKDFSNYVDPVVTKRMLMKRS